MNRLTPLVRSSLVSLSRFDHPAEETHRDPREEVSCDYSVNFLEHGCFALTIGRRHWQLTPGMLFVTYPGLVYRCRHFEGRPTDICLSVSYSSRLANEILQTTRSGMRALYQIARPTNRLAYLRLCLTQGAAIGGAPLAIETLAGELWAATDDQTSTAKLFKSHQLAWYRERINAVRSLLEEQYEEPQSLASLARTVGMSPFHFARVFRELAGMPPHRYLLKVRLRRAAERLREGASVTTTCFAVGFNNLSHFIRLFRRTFGVSPSSFVR